MNTFISIIKTITSILLLGVALPLAICLCIYTLVSLAVASPIIGLLGVMYYFWYLLHKA